MKLQIGFLLLALQFGVALGDKRSRQHAHLAHKRQNLAPNLAATSPTTSKASSAPAVSSTSTVSSATGPAVPSVSSSAASAPAIPGTLIPSVVSLSSTPTPTATGIPLLTQITSGMPSQPTDTVTATYTAGAQAPVSGAPPLPSPFVFSSADWPLQDHIPDITSQEVQTWMKELEGFNIPSFNPTADGSCVGDPAAAAQAATRGWWTCGGYTRLTDITACPDKLTWGVSFDDGPAPYTQTLLNYMNTKKLHSTFFVVGSRVIERPQVLLEEYMSGHEISVHTWSHKPLTSLTNAQIVAELGWTRKAIKHVLGVTPTTMRPPFGDIDDRVRAISLAMGLQPIIWTRTPSGGVFDTNDWRVGAGQVTGLQSYATFQTILNNATQLDTGFIVLQHDLFQITVDLAVGYTLDSALNHNPKLNLLPIGQCMKIPTTNLYMESTTNQTFPFSNHTYDIDGTGSASALKVSGQKNSGLTTSAPTFSALCLVIFGAIFSVL
ncbi:hypothetical protein AX15_002913 [Amanita polypyramis BW_CC]|nr:hypothetical protein AX15_002913 [Amanita polypyramis BW_CC]